MMINNFITTDDDKLGTFDLRKVSIVFFWL
jgi:hypothetical protein